MRALVLVFVIGCSDGAATLFDAAAEADTPAAPDAAGPCLPHMALVDTFCVDRYEGALDEQQLDGTWIAASP